MRLAFYVKRRAGSQCRKSYRRNGADPLSSRHAFNRWYPMFKRFLLATLMTHAFASASEGDVPQRVVIVAARDSEWASYRHAYGAAASFAKVVASRPLIQAHMQIRPLEPGLSLDGLHIVLEGETTKADIAVDAIGRATIPMLKKAYDEDAVLRLNRMKGSFRFSGRFTIREREDGVYSMAYLKSACEQLISAQRESGNRLRLWGKKCSAVTFAYRLDDTQAAIAVRTVAGEEKSIAAAVGHPFDAGNAAPYMVATLRFADWPADAHVAARMPLAIGTLY